MASSDHLRKQLQDLHTKRAKESRKESEASQRAARATEQAGKTRSATTMKSKLREADRYEKQALTAIKNRAALDGKIADVTKKLHAEETREAKENARALKRVEDELRKTSLETSLVVGQELDASLALEPHDAEFDFFISHASPDKDEIARPLAEALSTRGYRIWLDEWEIRVGDSIRQKIDEGLRRSRFGIVILSRWFLEGRTWTDRELNGLFVREEQAGEPRILPVWHNVTKDEVARYSPILADKASLKSADYTVDEMAELLAKRL